MIDKLKAYFVSDLHLGSDNEPNFILFVNWLKKLKIEGATHLFLMGDIFDLWIADHDYFKKKHDSIIAELVNLHKQGVEIHYFEGNHDLYLKKYWQISLGFFVHEKPSYFVLGPWRIRVEHGDQMDPEDRGYRFLRWFLRTPIMKWVAKSLPGEWVAKIGEKASEKSRHYTSEVKSITREKSLEKLHVYAEKVFQEDAFDWIFSGHIHIKDEYTFQRNNRVIKSVNLGSWFDEPTCFLLTNQGGSFQKVPGL